MADKVVELRKTQEEQVAPALATKPARSRSSLRLVLLVIIPLIALAGGAYFYLASGRYISTDNAYVGAQKVLITPDISGKIIKVTVKEGQNVKDGDELFTIDPLPRSTMCGATRCDSTNALLRLRSSMFWNRSAVQSSNAYE